MVRAPRIRGVRLMNDGEEYAVLELTPSLTAGSTSARSPTGDEQSGTEGDALLTRAESEVMELVIRGLSNRDIALARGTSARTIANQLQRLYRKLAVGSRVELLSKLVSAARD